MKTLITITILLILAGKSEAQVSEGTAVFNKAEQPAVTGEFNFPAAVTEQVLLDDLKYRGYGKGYTVKGFHRYEGIIFPDISPEKIDFYFKVNEKGKEKDKSIVTVLVSKGGGTFVSRSGDPAIVDSAKAYLMSLIPAFGKMKLQLDIEEQSEAVARAEKKYKNLVGEGETLVTRLKDLEAGIEKNKQEQEAQKTRLEKEKQLLETLKSRLK